MLTCAALAATTAAVVAACTDLPTAGAVTGALLAVGAFGCTAQAAPLGAGQLSCDVPDAGSLPATSVFPYLNLDGGCACVADGTLGACIGPIPSCDVPEAGVFAPNAIYPAIDGGACTCLVTTDWPLGTCSDLPPSADQRGCSVPGYGVPDTYRDTISPDGGCICRALVAGQAFDGVCEP